MVFRERWWKWQSHLSAVLLMLLVDAVTGPHLCHPALHLLQALQDGHPELIICRQKERFNEKLLFSPNHHLEAGVRPLQVATIRAHLEAPINLILMTLD